MGRGTGAVSAGGARDGAGVAAQRKRGCWLPGWDGRYLAAPSSVHDVVTTGSPGSAAVAPGGSGRAPASSPSLSAEDGGVEAGEAPVPTDGAAFPSKLGSGVGMSAACTALLAPQPIPRHRGGLY